MDIQKISKSGHAIGKRIKASIWPTGITPKGTYQFLSALLKDQIGESSPMPYFVQINSSQCRQYDGKMDQFDWRIHFQCLSFKERELEIVRPEVVWLQGATPRNYFWEKLRTFDNEVIRKLSVLDLARLKTLIDNYVRRFDGLSCKPIVISRGSLDGAVIIGTGLKRMT